MKLSKDDIAIIEGFFDNHELSRAFIWLYNRQESDIADTILESSDISKIIGFKRPGERYRVYCIKQDGVFYIKFLGSSAIRFNHPTYKLLTSMLDATNLAVSKNPDLVNTRKKAEAHPVKPATQSAPAVKAKAQDGDDAVIRTTDSEKKSVTITKLSVTDIETIANQLKEFEKAGAKYVSVRISYSSRKSQRKKV